MSDARSTAGTAYEDPDKRKNPATTDEAEAQNTRECITVAADATAGEGPTTLSTEQVRQGHTGDNMRYVLAASFVTVLIALFGGLMLFGVI